MTLNPLSINSKMIAKTLLLGVSPITRHYLNGFFALDTITGDCRWSEMTRSSYPQVCKASFLNKCSNDFNHLGDDYQIKKVFKMNFLNVTSHTICLIIQKTRYSGGNEHIQMCNCEIGTCCLTCSGQLTTNRTQYKLQPFMQIPNCCLMEKPTETYKGHNYRTRD